ncbi:MAG: biotin--[acetyl-CoA-carboxylase] ligase [Saprospiraceae bacterium]|nr:biotin--[acetyl-CoA-carboxylase] ligase [Saprospiraceae bacterium]MBK7738941.1 biotin--[acetyl-CoA-carboxylase] ligase [Saprospiraceae bacterium]MBK7913026.1 biotin--[acetyl-CoA-carboxylase] ligase [Saprospiraceae bacterium]
MEFEFPHIYEYQIDSTNRLASDLLSKTNPEHGFLVITDYQTDGKGQYGRFWQSTAGQNILASFIIYPHHVELEQIFRLHLASSLAIVDSLEPYSLPRLRIKWPNDIYSGNRKIAGILIQNNIKAGKIQGSVVGIGINVNQTEFPESLNASSIQLETGKFVSRESLVIKLRQELLRNIQETDEAVWDHMLKRYNELLYLKGNSTEFILFDGNTLQGIIQEVDPSGMIILLDNQQQRREFKFGEIKYLAT